MRIRNEGYVCPNCGWTSLENDERKERDHCPRCLSAVHQEDSDGNMCGGIMEPVGVWVRPDGTWEIIQRCGFCGEMKTAELSEEDSSVKILSIASKPLASPPFPVEKIEELTMIMGGNDFEPRK